MMLNTRAGEKTTNQSQVLGMLRLCECMQGVSIWNDRHPRFVKPGVGPNRENKSLAEVRYS